jgi:hypothetical protein
MIGRLAGVRGKLSSHWLASVFAAGYLVLSIVLGVALLTSPASSTRAAAPVASTPTYIFQDTPTDAPIPVPNKTDDSGALSTTTTPPPPTTTTSRPPATPPAPDGYQRVSGPAGLRTVIPAGWHSARATGPGAMLATDPVGSGRYVKYGGSTAPDLAIETSHVQYENGFAIRALDYKRIKLQSATYGGHDAVQWEFEHREGSSVKHVCSLYWRADGKEYFVMAASPADNWSQMRSVYDTMVANATP